MRASKLASFATLVATVGLAVLLAFVPVDASPLALTTTHDARASLTCCDCVGGNCLPRCCDEVKSTLNVLALRAFYGVEAPRAHLKQDQDKSTPFARRALDEASTVHIAARALDHAEAMTNILDVRVLSKDEQVRPLDLDYAAGTADGCTFAYGRQDGHVVDAVARAVPDRENNANPLSAREVNAQVDARTITNVAQLGSRDDNDYDPCVGCPCAGTTGTCSPACCYIVKRSFYGILGLTPAAASPDPAARDVVLNQGDRRNDVHQVTQLDSHSGHPCFGCECAGLGGACSPSCCYNAKRSFDGLLGLTPAAASPELAARLAVRDVTLLQADPRTAIHEVTQLDSHSGHPCFGCECAGLGGACSPSCCYIAKQSFYGLLGLTPASAAPKPAARDVNFHQADPRTATHEVTQLARRGDSPPDPPECCACNEYFCSHACCAGFKENDVEIFHTIRALPGVEAAHAEAAVASKDLKEEVKRDVCSENGLGCSCTAYTCSPLCCADSNEEGIKVSPVIRTIPGVEDAHAEASLVPKEINQCAGLGCPCDPYSCSELCCATSEEMNTAVSPVIRTIHGIGAADPGAALVPKELNKAEKRDYCSQHGLGCECGAGWCSEDCCATSETIRSHDSATAAQLAVRAHQIGHAEIRAASFGYLVPKGLSQDEKRDYCSEHGYGCFCSSSGSCAHACCLSSEEQARAIDNPPVTRALHGIEAENLKEEAAKRGQLGEDVQSGLPSSMLVKRPVGCDKPGVCLCADTGECSADCCHGTTSRALSLSLGQHQEEHIQRRDVKTDQIDPRGLDKDVQLGGSLKAAKRQGCLPGGCPCDPEGAYCSTECCTTKRMDGRAFHGDQPRSNNIARALLLDPVQPEEQLHKRNEPSPRDVEARHVDPRALAQNSGLEIGDFERRSQGDSGCCTCIPVGGCLLECCATSSVVSEETAPELVRALDGEEEAAPRD